VFDFKQDFVFLKKFKLSFILLLKFCHLWCPQNMTLISKKHFLEKKTFVKSSYYERKKRESLTPPHRRKNFLKKITSKKITPPNTIQYNHIQKNPLKEDKKIKHFKLLCSLHPTFVNKFTPKLATLSSQHTFDSPPLICVQKVFSR